MPFMTRHFVRFLPACLILCLIVFSTPVLAETSPGFAITDTDFTRQGKPIQIRSGEMHFQRVPPEYWANRLRLLHAAGFNTVSTYIFWNMVEPKPGQFDWSGSSDIAEFCRLAQKEGLMVILRPGPYACGEWEFGGFPWWLLKNKDIKLRTQDPYYLERVGTYLHEVGRVLAPLQTSRGGPIVLVQVENEYGSYGKDREYMGKVRDMLKAAGFDGPFYTSDGPSQLKNDVRDDIFATVNGGGFDKLREIRPKGPLMCGEFYPGWFDSWGSKHHTTGAEEAAKFIDNLLSKNISFSMYMAHGGTSFGLWSGANCPPFSPQTSSYDYDAPINEAGWTTPKFDALKKVMTKYLAPGETLPEVPPRLPVIAMPEFTLTQVAPVFANLPAPVATHDEHPRTMEEYDQGYGCILYRTTLPAGPAGRLAFDALHDYGLIYLDGKKIATLDRRRGQTTCALPARDRKMMLDVFIEAMGRVNYGPALKDFKGIVGSACLIAADQKQDLTGWDVVSLPLDDAELGRLKYEPLAAVKVDGPAFYRGTFHLDQTGDTFLDMRTMGKGVAWINGHALGRFWNIGPTQTMYVPGPWLKQGDNEAVVLDIDGPEKPALAGLSEPILDQVKAESALIHRKPGQSLQLAEIKPVSTGSLTDSTEWQTASFSAPAKGRYLCLEVTSSQTPGEKVAALAELYLVGEDGKDLSRDKWKVVYADSEEVDAEDATADHVFDLQPGTCWRSSHWHGEKPAYPHAIVIDLGEDATVTGIRLLQRQDSGHGRFKDFRVFLQPGSYPGL